MSHGADNGPYLEALLTSPHTELNLSGNPPFRLQIVVTLHAVKPVILYTDDSILSRYKALRMGGIEFFRVRGTGKPEPRGSSHQCTFGNGPQRAWSPECFLVLKPGESKTIDIPFGKEYAPSSSRSSNLGLWLFAGVFEPGQSYTAALPGKQYISWWRWASPQEVENNSLQVSSGLLAALSNMASWWNGSDPPQQDAVPILAAEEQMPIKVLGNGVTFRCVGEPVPFPPISRSGGT